MIAKPAISFLNDDSDALLCIDAGNIVAKMTNNPVYPNPSPLISVVSTALNAFTVALAPAAGGAGRSPWPRTRAARNW